MKAGKLAAFDANEYDSRLKKIKTEMSEKGIDVLLCSDPANMNYITGYDGWSFYVHQLVIVALEYDQPMWIGREMDAPGAHLTTLLHPENILSYGEEYVDAPQNHPMKFVAQILDEKGLASGCLGIEKDSWYFTAQALETLREHLPNTHFVDGFGLVNKVRLIKSTAEISYMRAAGQIANLTMQAGIQAIEPGQRECDVAAAVAHAQFSGTEAFFGDYPAALAQVPSGSSTAAPHLTWSDTRYEENCITYLEIAGCHRRYHAPLARSVCLGTPPRWLTEMVPVVEDGMCAALDAAVAGQTCASVEAAWRTVIARSGYIKESRIGYSVGVGYPPDWGERTACLRSGDETILRENMCFHVILGMWGDNSGYEISETIRISDSGRPELLTGFSRDLIIKN